MRRLTRHHRDKTIKRGGEALSSIGRCAQAEAKRKWRIIISMQSAVEADKWYDRNLGSSR